MPAGNAIGMSTGVSALPGMSPADQVAGETEEQRRKRLQQLQAARQLPGVGQSQIGGGYGAALGSM